MSDLKKLKRAYSLITEKILNERIGGNKYANRAADIAKKLLSQGKQYENLRDFENDVLDLFIPMVCNFDSVSPYEAEELWVENIEDIVWYLENILGKKDDDGKETTPDVDKFFSELREKLDELYEDYSSERYDELVPRGFKIKLIADDCTTPVLDIWNVDYDSTTDTATFDLFDYAPITVSKIKEHVVPSPHPPSIFSSEGVAVSGEGLSQLFGLGLKRDVVYCDMDII